MRPYTVVGPIPFRMAGVLIKLMSHVRLFLFCFTETKSNSAAVSGSYVDVFKSCRECFISDVSADPDRLVQKLEASNGVVLSSAIKRKLERETNADGKAEILFNAILPQINEYGNFFDVVQILRDPFQHLSNSLWEQLKNIVVPPKSKLTVIQ